MGRSNGIFNNLLEIDYIWTMEPYTKSKPSHIGQKVRGIRELRGKKQETMADELGISQQAVSKLEQSEHIEDETLERIAGVLDVSLDTIKNFNEEAVVYNIQHNHEGANSGASNIGAEVRNYNCTFNPLDKLMEVIEENKRLYEELLKKERETVAMLQQVIEGKGWGVIKDLQVPFLAAERQAKMSMRPIC